MNASIDYGSVLSRAWHITWRHKVLWIFGILAGCSNSGSSSGSGSNNNVSVNDRGGIELPPEVERYAREIERFFNQDPTVWLPWVLGIGCVALLIGLVFYVLGLIGESGLIHGAALADSTGNVTFGEAWAVGVQKIVPLFLLRLLIAVPIIILVGLLVLLTVGTAGLFALCLIPLLCVLVPAGIVVSIWQYFAQYFIVLENAGVVDSLRRSWALLRQHWAPVLILGLITIVGSFIIGLVLALPFLLAVLPTIVILISSASQNVQPDWTAFLPTLICGGLYLPVLIVLSGVLTTFITSAWTILFKRLTGQAAVPVVVEPIPA